METKIVIFDMDGTVLDTLEDLYLSMNHVLKENNLPLHTKDEIRMFVGNGIFNLCKRSVPFGSDDGLVQKVFAEFKEYYSIHSMDNTKPYENVVGLMEKLKSKGIKVAINTNKVDSASQDLCKKFFPDLVDMAVGQREGVPIKPAPDGIYLILNTLGVNKENALYLGDSDVDLQCGINAGINTVGVTWGFRSREFLLENGASVLIDDPLDLLKLV